MPEASMAWRIDSLQSVGHWFALGVRPGWCWPRPGGRGPRTRQARCKSGNGAILLVEALEVHELLPGTILPVDRETLSKATPGPLFVPTPRQSIPSFGSETQSRHT